MSIKNIIIISLFAIIGIGVWLLNIGLVWKIAIDVWAATWVWVTIEIINAPLMEDIKTEYYPKPIPLRGFDWEAWEENADEDGCIGYGRTEEAAIKDLLEKMGEI